MNEHMDLMARMAVAEGRLAAFAEDPPPGLTDPDPATGEQWDAGQAWAHVAEFVPYWQTEMQKVVAGVEQGVGPVPFGRTSADPGRVGAIEAGRHEPPDQQMARLAECPGPGPDLAARPERRPVVRTRRPRAPGGDDRGPDRRAIRGRPPRGARRPAGEAGHRPKLDRNPIRGGGECRRSGSS